MRERVGPLARWLVPGALAILVALVLMVYAPVRAYDFISFDDPSYVSENPHVAGGLTWAGVSWAFTTLHAGYWIPLTWFSYMADVQIAGPGAGAHHATNVLLHLASTLLLFGLLLRLTGAAGRSLLVAALFAVHPLHVESVAWVTERKDALSTVFLMLALRSYVGYVRRPSVARYALVAASFACGLMAKPVVVTLPLLLLLLDVWPLGRVTLAREQGVPAQAAALRVTRVAWTRAVVEKVPLLLLAVAAGVITFIAQHGAGAVLTAEKAGPGLRVATAITACVTYIRKAIWPAGLAVFYPYEPVIRWWATGAALLVLTIVSFLVLRLRRQPYLAVGWLWYLVALVPMAGLVQVGSQWMADRFTYVPLIGLVIIVAWGVPALLPSRQRVLAVLSACLVAGYAAVASVQVRTWSDDQVLWRHALDVTPDNFMAHNSLGRRLFDQGRTDEAGRHFAETVRLASDFPDGHNNLGLVFLRQGRLDEAIAQFREAIGIGPTAQALTNLSVALAQRGDLDEATARGVEAIRLEPGLAEAQFNVGQTLTRRGRLDEALGHLSEARRLRPDLAATHRALGEVLARLGRLNEAVAACREAVRLDAADADARHGLAAVLAAQGHTDEATVEYSEAVRLAPDRAFYQNDLGFALATQGRAAEAIPHFSEAVRLAPTFELAHYYLGLALAGSGRFREAASEFGEVLRLNPRNEGAARALARLPKS
jgi:tetratricopeptide (TPR) repeat protein